MEKFIKSISQNVPIHGFMERARAIGRNVLDFIRPSLVSCKVFLLVCTLIPIIVVVPLVSVACRENRNSIVVVVQKSDNDTSFSYMNKTETLKLKNFLHDSVVFNTCVRENVEPLRDETCYYVAHFGTNVYVCCDRHFHLKSLHMYGMKFVKPNIAFVYNALTIE
jgi:hypothetical protein